jgi:glyoxylase-like metal-dependent hydrolase (beta-lactamase superfamily II)
MSQIHRRPNEVIETLDLEFQGYPGAIASYLIRHSCGSVLVETGPGSTIPTLQSKLQEHGLHPHDISDVLLTHIHLDHAGASGWLARQGARIHVHHVGAPHLENPEKLLSSAHRIYGDSLQELWGEFLPVPSDLIVPHHDGDLIEIHGLNFRLLDTPGHAYHHMVYLFEDTCFTGDIGGVRIGGLKHIRMPMPPPEFHLETWLSSVHKLLQEYQRGSFRRIAPTHFGIFSDPDWHLAEALKELTDVGAWLEAVLPDNLPFEQLNRCFLDWVKRRSLQAGLTEADIEAYETANPSWMSTAGLQRYWQKYRQPNQSIQAE